MNKEAVRKMKLARKYQKEALMELVPANIRGNLENIEKEMKEMVFTCLIDGGMETFKNCIAGCPEPAETAEESDKKVKKVNIG